MSKNTFMLIYTIFLKGVVLSCPVVQYFYPMVSLLKMGIRKNVLSIRSILLPGMWKYRPGLCKGYQLQLVRFI